MKQILFVDDEIRVLQGLQRQLHSMCNTWQVNFVSSGSQALEFMAAVPVDVLVTDLKMPGMDGAQLLLEVQKRHPATVRLVLSGHAESEMVLRLVGPAHQFMTKPCDPQELRDAISRSFAVRDLLANEHLKRLAAQMNSLPTLPSLYTQLIKELRKPDTDIETISEIVAQDLGMTSKILQLVNSAFFGLPQPMSRTADAVQYLGLNTMRDLVLSLQVFSQFEQKISPDCSIQELFQHSYQTADLARKIAIAENCDSIFQDQCFLAGLLHDVGKLVLAAGMPQQYARVLQTARKLKVSLLEAEHAEYGATHAEVGGYLLGLWGLLGPVVEAVTLHHRPKDALSRGFSPVIAVHVADNLANDLAVCQKDWPENEMDQTCLAKLNLTERLAIWKADFAVRSTPAAAR
jgi:HD-like signal output (HDOD) protein